MASKKEESAAVEKAPAPLEDVPVEVVPLENIQKSRWERSWPTIACGAGLFSDGYLNGVCIPSVHGSTQERMPLFGRRDLGSPRASTNDSILRDVTLAADMDPSRLSAPSTPCCSRSTPTHTRSPPPARMSRRSRSPVRSLVSSSSESSATTGRASGR